MSNLLKRIKSLLEKRFLKSIRLCNNVFLKLFIKPNEVVLLGKIVDECLITDALYFLIPIR